MLRQFWSILSANGASNRTVKSKFFVTNIKQRCKTSFSDNIEDNALYELLRGTCLQTLRAFARAVDCLTRVVAAETALPDDHRYLVPNALFELASVCADTRQYDEAMTLLARARTYHGFALENKLNFAFMASSNE